MNIQSFNRLVKRASKALQYDERIYIYCHNGGFVTADDDAALLYEEWGADLIITLFRNKPFDIGLVRPILDFKFLGTDIRLDKNKTYLAIAATNQPEYKEKKKIFIFDSAFGWTPCLEVEDYETIV